MKTTIVRFPKDNGHLLEALRERVRKNRRSLNSELLLAIEYYLGSVPDPKKEVKKSTHPST